MARAFKWVGGIVGVDAVGLVVDDLRRHGFAAAPLKHHAVEHTAQHGVAPAHDKGPLAPEFQLDVGRDLAARSIGRAAQ